MQKQTGSKNKGKKQTQNAPKKATPSVKGVATTKTVLAAPTKRMAVTQIRQQQASSIAKRKIHLKKRSLDFFTSATDPMHDNAIRLQGWPDRNIELSVVRKIPQVVSVGFPIGNSNFEPSPGVKSNYDLHIILQPWLQRMDMKEQQRSGNTIRVNTIGSQSYIGGLQAYATLPGTDFSYGSNNPVSGTVPLLAEMQLAPNVTQGVGRVVGIGIELVNTTAQLYINGQVYCWRAPEPMLSPTTWNYTTVESGHQTDSFSASAQVYRYPPINVAEATLYTGTVNWPAKEGAYMVGTFTDYLNPAHMVDYTVPVLLSIDSVEDKTYVPGDNSTVNETQVWVPNFVASPDESEVYAAPGVKLYPYNQMGMICTGLTPESTFTMKLNVYYESFPSVAQNDILTLANPSTPYDPVVLELLSNVMRSLPVGVPSKENAEGDWWDRVIQALQYVAPATLALFGGEVLAPLVYSGLGSIRSYRNLPSK